MTTSSSSSGKRSGQRGEPAWDVALLFPPQGEWTEEEYLGLDTRHMVELSDGCVEVLPMPTILHQLIVKFLFLRLNDHVTRIGAGTVLFAPCPVRLWAGKMREPDIVFLRPGRVANPRRPPEGADLVVEVVSEGDESRHRDLETKRQEYARAGIPEYWIVDPEQRTVTVLVLAGDDYAVHGRYGPGAAASSKILAGFEVDVSALVDAGE